VNNTAQRRSSPGIVFFALGLVSLIDDGTANAGLVLAVANELGLPPTAARAVILRLRNDGQVTSQRIGRSARYTVGSAVAVAQRRWTEHFREGSPPWDGTFAGLLYDFPERDRPRRDRLRRVARIAGYGLLRPGLLISPDDRWHQLAQAFGTDEQAGRILRVGLTLASSKACSIARDLWELDRLAERYREIARTTSRMLANPSGRAGGENSSPIARLYQATQPIYDAVAQDPALPHELLPADWPAHQLGAALARANAILGPSAVEQLHALKTNL